MPSFDTPGNGRPNGFLDVPARSGKPRTRGLTHVIDKGLNLRDIEGLFDTAGEYVDVVKLGWGTSYVTRNLAHPFRKGYYAETERRIIAMYTALYATSFDDVLRFAEKEKVDYFIYRTSTFKALDKQLFNPPKKKLAVAARQPTAAVAAKAKRKVIDDGF